MLSRANEHAPVVTEPSPLGVMGRQVREGHLAVLGFRGQHHPEMASLIQAEECVSRVHPALARDVRRERTAAAEQAEA